MFCLRSHSSVGPSLSGVPLSEPLASFSLAISLLRVCDRSRQSQRSQGQQGPEMEPDERGGLVF